MRGSAGVGKGEIKMCCGSPGRITPSEDVLVLDFLTVMKVRINSTERCEIIIL